MTAGRAPSAPTSCPQTLPRPQYGALTALVELVPRDERVWARRLERRGERESGTEHAHKPGSWAAAEAMRARDSGSEAWSAAVHIRLHCVLDSTAGSTQEHLTAVLGMLAAAGVAGAEAAAAALAVVAAADGRGDARLSAACARSPARCTIT